LTTATIGSLWMVAGRTGLGDGSPGTTGGVPLAAVFTAWLLVQAASRKPAAVDITRRIRLRRRRLPAINFPSYERS
jgi:hypothetical protein